MEKDLLKTISGLDNDTLSDLRKAADAEAEQRRPKATLEMIRPGMTPEEDALVRAEIVRAMSKW